MGSKSDRTIDLMIEILGNEGPAYVADMVVSALEIERDEVESEEVAEVYQVALVAMREALAKIKAAEAANKRGHDEKIAEKIAVARCACGKQLIEGETNVGLFCPEHGVPL